MKQIILVAGGTGNIGERLVRELHKLGAHVRVLARLSSDSKNISELKALGVEVVQLDMMNQSEVSNACLDVSCLVSTLAGLQDVIIDAQKVLVEAALAAGVPRFIPSDFSLDFTKLAIGENRNLDFRKEFHTYLNNKPIAVTSIFNGAFTELLTGDMPLILSKVKKILYWGNADQQLDFTTMHDTAVFTAHVAMDDKSPRYLRIAGDQISARQMVQVVGPVSNKTFKLFKAGNLSLLGMLLKFIRAVKPGKGELYPVWQGMQYMHNMMSGRGKLIDLDNDRYPSLKWTNVESFLKQSNSDLNLI